MPEKIVNTRALFSALRPGRDNGQGVHKLALLLDTEERAVRKLVDELIEEGVPVCAHPSTGYYIAATEAEVEGVCRWLHGRAVHSLGKISKLRHAFAKFTGADYGADEPLPEL